jgi:hypothetical protein
VLVYQGRVPHSSHSRFTSSSANVARFAVAVVAMAGYVGFGSFHSDNIEVLLRQDPESYVPPPNLDLADVDAMLGKGEPLPAASTPTSDALVYPCTWAPPWLPAHARACKLENPARCMIHTWVVVAWSFPEAPVLSPIPIFSDNRLHFSRGCDSDARSVRAGLPVPHGTGQVLDVCEPRGLWCHP